MKIQTINGRVIAEAETLADIQTLLTFNKPHAIASGRIPGTRFNKKHCPVPGCEKTVKYLNLHLKRNHSTGYMPLEEFTSAGTETRKPLFARTVT